MRAGKSHAVVLTRMKLNPSQHEVASTRDPRVLVLAGAGTGKTATSVHWVCNLIQSGASRSQILMITFTRKAANEMASRVENLIAHIPRQGSQDSLTVGTYHAVASILLRQEAEKFGLLNSRFSTIDESEAQSIWKSALKQCGIEAKSSLFVPGRLHELYSFARNTCTPLNEVFEPHFRSHTKRIPKIVATYEELKKAANVVDYDDLLVLWEQRLKKDPEYAAHLRQRWPFVLVDEMQDNNRLNESILDHLAPQHLMVVGDVNQSIYGFRGAEAKLIGDFARKNPQVRILKLECNYRSGQKILDLANEIVAQSPSALRLQSHNGAVGHIEYLTFLNPTHEAQGVINWIQDKMLEGERPNEIAVLSRSSRFLTAMEVMLNSHKIRYKKYGGLTLADAAEVKDFLSFLRVSLNDHDKIALLRALMQFPGIGEGTAAKVIAQHQGQSQDDWPEAAKELGLWVEEIRKQNSLGEKGKLLFEKIKPLILANYPKDGEERLGTLQTMVNSMESTPGTLAEFLDGFSLSRQTDDFHPHDAIVLSTIHSSKGLEWNNVWLIGAGSTQIPHPRTLETGETEEERRLFYVAVTRARNHLVISYPGLTDRKQGQNPCPFIPEKASWRYM